MKKCPQCGNTYTDPMLRYCLADGTTLEDDGPEQETVVGRGGTVRVDVPETKVINSVALPQRSSALPKILIGLLIGVVLIAAAVVGIAAVMIFMSASQKGGDVPIDSANKISSPTPDLEKEKLRDELANLQKKLDERAADSKDTQPFPDISEDLLDDLPTATVNSPNDGFLALRSEPNTEYGERLAQIPHGANVIVVSCDDESVTIGARTGKWCLIEWNNKAGWVFDAWLDHKKAGK